MQCIIILRITTFKSCWNWISFVNYIQLIHSPQTTKMCSWYNEKFHNAHKMVPIKRIYIFIYRYINVYENRSTHQNFIMYRRRMEGRNRIQVRQLIPQNQVEMWHWPMYRIITLWAIIMEWREVQVLDSFIQKMFIPPTIPSPIINTIILPPYILTM